MSDWSYTWSKFCSCFPSGSVKPTQYISSIIVPILILPTHTYYSWNYNLFIFSYTDNSSRACNCSDAKRSVCYKGDDGKQQCYPRPGFMRSGDKFVGKLCCHTNVKLKSWGIMAVHLPSWYNTHGTTLNNLTLPSQPPHGRREGVQQQDKG